ncbi:pol polyprotein [Caprine arthritis encephalitis virus Ov496]|uniref:Pol polyprotein n=1 Tax=Caprine arthritis encephalitis virus Ov496 TaxID=621214 RepID=C0JIG9_CAEV|nr:pol polyprotein [Caprine arthritis encephalitis virus Ov496]
MWKKRAYAKGLQGEENRDAVGKWKEGATCGAVRSPYGITTAPPMVQVRIGSKWRNLLFDTGADRTIIRWHDGSGIPAGRIKLQGIGGIVEGEKWDNVKIEYKGETRKGPIVVLPQSPVEVLGRDNMEKFGIEIIMANLEDKKIPITQVHLKEGCMGPHVPQWPLTEEKLKGLTEIIDKLLEEGKLGKAPPHWTWNTPIFCIKKKSGKWRMLIDFRELNKQTENLTEAQLGLPHPGGLQKKKHVTVLDIGDAYFTIPLYEPYQKYTCFTLLSPNNLGPCKRYYWKVLPQGWKLSPSVYQFTMQKILEDWIQQHPDIQFGIYMDDIYIGSDLEIKKHRKIVKELANYIAQYGFTLPEDKRQEGYPAKWLGFELHPQTWKFQKHTLPELRIGTITLNKLQKLVGELVWRQSIIGKSIPNILKLMEGDRALQSERRIEEIHVKEWEECRKKLAEAEGHYLDPEKDIYGQIAWGNKAIEYIVYQEKEKPLWVNVVHDIKNLSIPQQVIKAAQKLTQEVVIRTGKIPWILLPGKEEDWRLELQLGNITWMPKFWSCYRGQTRWRRRNITEEIVEGPTYYTDGGKKNKVGSLGFITSAGEKVRQHEEGTNQQLELRAIEEALKHGPTTMNIVTDSRYAFEFLLRDWDEETIRNPIQARIMEIAHKKNRIGIHWVPGHKGIPQNEEVDRYISEVFLAREGEGILPKREEDAGYDLLCPEEVIIGAGQVKAIPIDLRINLKETQWAMIATKSSMAAKGVFTQGGIIDSGYQGQIQVIIYNSNKVEVVIPRGRKFAQLILMEKIHEELEPWGITRKTERGTKGFGSTGMYWIENIPIAEEEHAKWHQDAQSLHLEFNIPRTAAEDIVSQCETCQQEKAPSIIRGSNKRGIDHWQVDYTHYENHILLVWVETNSGLIYAEKVKGESGQEFRIKVMQWFALFSPESLQSDNGPAFVAEPTQLLMKYLGIQHMTGIPWNPQSQALVERAHQTLKRTINKFKDSFIALESAIAAALVAINIKRKGGLGTSPMDIFIYNKEQKRVTNKYNKNSEKMQFCYYRTRKRGHPGDWEGPTQVLWKGEGAIVIKDKNSEKYLVVPNKDAKFIPPPTKEKG